MIRRAIELTRLTTVALPIVAVALALGTTIILLVAAGANPLEALNDMWSAAMGSTYAVGSTLVKSLPRLIAGLAVAVALRAGLWNIGVEGQLYAGAVGAAGMALFGPSLPSPIGPAVVLMAGMLAGAAWALIPGLLRAYKGISEVITSLMFVYIGIQMASYFVTGPWGVPGATFPATRPIPDQTRLPIVSDSMLLHAGVFVVIVVAFLTWVLLDRTTLGVRFRAVGGNLGASAAMGLNVRRLLVISMCISGALAGLVGGIEVAGTRGMLVAGFSPGYGFEGIAVALLGRLRVGGIIAAALLFGALDAGGAGLQTSGTGLSASIVQVTSALAVLYLLAALGLKELHTKRAKARAALASADSTDEGTGAVETTGVSR